MSLGEFERMADLARLRKKSSPSKPGIAPGAVVTMLLVEGDYIEAKASDTGAGTIEVRNSAGALFKTIAFGPKAAFNVGPYRGTNSVSFTATTGSIDAVVADAVLGGLSVGAIPNQISGPGGFRYVLSGNSRSQLPKTTAKLAKIRLGKITGANGSDGQLRLAYGPGDSTVTGAGGGTGPGLLVGARARNVVAALKAQINKRGIRCIDDSIMGDQLTNTILGVAGYSQFDPRLAFTGTAGIFPNGNMRSLGGVYFRLNALTDSMIFQPSEAWDTARIHTVNASAGAASISINNGESTAGITGNTRITTTNIGQAAFASQVITKAKGTQALTIGNVAGAGNANIGTPVIRGIEVWDSTIPAVNLIGLGEYGTRLSLEYTNSAFQAALLADQYDCVVIDMAINDINAGGLAALPAYLLALDQTVTAAKAAGSDVIICTPNCVNLTRSTVDAYNAAIINYALVNNVYLLDINAEMGEFSAASANGLMADSLHPADVGYQVKAVPLANLLTSV